MDEHAPGRCNGMLCMRSLFMVVMLSWALRGPVDGPEVCIIPWASGRAGIYISPASGRAELPHSVGQWTGRKRPCSTGPVDGPAALASGQAMSLLFRGPVGGPEAAAHSVASGQARQSRARSLPHLSCEGYPFGIVAGPLNFEATCFPAQWQFH